MEGRWRVEEAGNHNSSEGATTMSTKTIAFRNEVQVALWSIELEGQISDGNWENSRPFDHYTPWMQCTVIVDPSNLGRSFPARRDRYNFTEPRLLDVVGERMLKYARLTLKYGLTRTLEVVNKGADVNGVLQLEPLASLNVDQAMLDEMNSVAASTHEYKLRDLKRELQDMKHIIREYRLTPEELAKVLAAKVEAEAPVPATEELHAALDAVLTDAPAESTFYVLDEPSAEENAEYEAYLNAMKKAEAAVTPTA
jgi:DNA-binding Lrp family transcriptional regulator